MDEDEEEEEVEVVAGGGPAAAAEAMLLPAASVVDTLEPMDSFGGGEVVAVTLKLCCCFVLGHVMLRCRTS